MSVILLLSFLVSIWKDLSNVTRALATDSSFLVLGLGSIGTGLSQAPEDTTL